MCKVKESPRSWQNFLSRNGELKNQSEERWTKWGNMHCWIHDYKDKTSSINLLIGSFPCVKQISNMMEISRVGELENYLDSSWEAEVRQLTALHRKPLTKRILEQDLQMRRKSNQNQRLHKFSRLPQLGSSWLDCYKISTPQSKSTLGNCIDPVENRH